MLKPDKRPPTSEELNLSLPSEGLTFPLIADGKVFPRVLRYHGLTGENLKEELQKKGISSPEEVFFASVDKNQKLYIIKQDEEINPPPLRL